MTTMNPEDFNNLYAKAPVLRIYNDAREDSLVAAYSLIIVAPICALVSHWLLSRGKRTTVFQVVFFSFLVPALLFGLPAAYEWNYGPVGVYRMLQLSRHDPIHVWANRYAHWRDLYRSGEMPESIWVRIDQAYDHLYDETGRMLYDFWGPGTKDMTLGETNANVALFYILWLYIVWALTTPKQTARASKWAYSFLIAILGLELSMRLVKYDPIKTRPHFAFMTPRDLIMWLHRLYPIIVFTILGIKRVFYVDLVIHYKRLQDRMLEVSKEIRANLDDMAEIYNNAEE